MRKLDDVDPKEMTFGELLRANAEAVLHVYIYGKNSGDMADAKRTYWRERLERIERTVNERYGR